MREVICSLILFSFLNFFGCQNKKEVLVNQDQNLLAEIANKYAHELPAATRFFLSRLGVDFNKGSQLLSYVLFEGAYCQHLIELGYNDTLARKAEVESFFQFD